MTEIVIAYIESPYPFDAYAYIIEPLSEDDGGGYLISFPDLPGCISDGETLEEAVVNGRDACSAWMSARAHIGADSKTHETWRECLSGTPDAAIAAHSTRQLGGASESRRYIP